MRIAWVLPDGERKRRFSKMKRNDGLRNKVTSREHVGSLDQLVVPARARGAPVLSISNEEWDVIVKVHK